MPRDLVGEESQHEGKKRERRKAYMSRSQRYFKKPLLRRLRETRATCELSIA
jgi:hypothetical protein